MNSVSTLPVGQRGAAIVAALKGRCLVMIGMMGSGKTSVGRRLAARLSLPFADADNEIEIASGMSVPEIFARRGEAEFREGERKVVARLLRDGPKVLSTGGGAYNDQRTRSAIAAQGIAIWLKADFDVLMRRVRKRSNRPLLQTADPDATLRRLIEERYPIYAEAALTVESHDGPHEAVIEAVLRALEHHLGLDTKLSPDHVTHEPVISVHVGLAGRAYDILIGPDIIAEAGHQIAALAPGAACAIITDENVAKAHGRDLETALNAQAIRHATLVLPPGEATKSYAHFQQACDFVIANRMERGDLVIAFGGGVIGDLAGFVAASVRRGMRFVQIPTSLLAQVDSSVGGKTGINSPHGKNLIGAFHQPSLVLADSQALETLPEREFRAGYAEVVKYGLIDQPEFFFWLEAHAAEIFAGGPARQHAIATACRAKAEVVLRDEFEQGDRAFLNLGHTFAHALERLTHYDGTRLVHGEAVAVGLCCAFRFSQRQSLCSGQDAGRVEAHLRRVGLPTRIQDIPGLEGGVNELIAAMYQDKKVVRGQMTFILAHGIGMSFIARGVAETDVRAFLEADLTLEAAHHA